MAADVRIEKRGSIYFILLDGEETGKWATRKDRAERIADKVRRKANRPDYSIDSVATKSGYYLDDPVYFREPQ